MEHGFGMMLGPAMSVSGIAVDLGGMQENTPSVTGMGKGMNTGL